MLHKWMALLLAVALMLGAVPALAESDADARVGQILSGMSIEQKVYQMFVITPEMLTGSGTVTKAGDATRKALKAHPVGGLIYFAANLKDRKQTTSMIQNSQKFAQEEGIPGLFIAVDEEGGSVARVASKLNTTKFSAMMTLAKKGDPQLIFDAYSTIAADISQFGFNLDFAPVADVITNSKNTEIGNRAFGTDAGTVSTMVPEAVNGLQQGGVIAALKHFPGHGNTTANSHYNTTTTARTLDEMRALEFLPFSAGIDAGAEIVLMSHLTATKLDDSLPASMNKTIITDILRGELGFEGVVCTDALRMLAIASNYSPEQIARNCVNAGVDILLMPASFQATSAALIELVQNGEITEQRIDESVRRILKLKLKYGIAE
ncbi:hypothetical protein LJC33_07125 [Eubacteriales bacterium OttesenSCG-928-N13]|nr:hypothetical protein [Eubacteriales bacterium OttesenSCG-928-N13]